MTPAELKAALRETGLRQRAFAELTGVTVLTVNRWCTGKLPVPKWAGLLFATRDASVAALKLSSLLAKLCLEFGLIGKIQERIDADQATLLHSAISDTAPGGPPATRSQTGDIPPS